MNRKVILDYTDHWLVLIAFTLSRSATLINFCSFNSISPALAGRAFFVQWKCDCILSPHNSMIMLLMGWTWGFISVWVMQTIPARVNSTEVLLFFMERVHPIRGHTCCFSGTSAVMELFCLHLHRDGWYDPDFYGINITICVILYHCNTCCLHTWNWYVNVYIDGQMNKPTVYPE